MFSNDKAYLKDCKEKIGRYLDDELRLQYSKAEVFDVKQGVDFCGYRHFKKYLLLRKSSAKRMKRRFKKMEVSTDYKKLESQIASANGQLKHCCSYNLQTALNIDELRETVKERIKCGKQ